MNKLLRAWIALLLTWALLCPLAIGEETVDWKNFDAVLHHVQEAQPAALALGETKFTLEQLCILQEALPPDAEFTFTMYLCKTWIDSKATEVDLDQGLGLIDDVALERIIALMPQVTAIYAYTHQNLTNELMMPLVDKYPDIWFGWLVRLGKDYKIRSDATAFSTRKGPRAPFYTSEDLEVLRYVPGLKAIDVGHNHVEDLTFLTHFPQLRILILADNNITDLTPLGQLTELEYLELFMNEITDLSPLSGLTHLLDLNVCHNQISDVSVLDGLTALERFYCSYNQVSQEQIDHFEAQHPECLTNWLVYSSTGALWREHPRYEQYRKMFISRVYHPFETETKK